MGQNEHSVPSVAGANVGRAYTTPLRIEPERGQVPENGAHSPESIICWPSQIIVGVSVAIGVEEEPWDVLEEAKFGSDFSDDPGDIGPDPPGVVGSRSLASQRKGLAREAGRDDMNSATEGAPVKCGDVRPGNKRRERSFVNARRNPANDANFPFHHAHGTVSREGDIKAKLEPESAGAEPKPVNG